MFENENNEITAQETISTEDVAEGVEVNADLDENQDNVNDAEFRDTENETLNEVKQEPKNTPTQNSENARRRREAERKAELKKVREDAIIEVLGGINPFTNEQMTDSADIEEYLTMKEIQKNGGDPIADFSKFAKQKAKEEIESRNAKAKQDEWFAKDADEFRAKHPDVDISKLSADKNFKRFADGKLGVVSMNNIYESYMEFVSEFEKSSKEYASKIIANAKATPGALKTSSASQPSFFTKEQVEKMSQEEVDAKLDLIKESMKKW